MATAQDAITRAQDQLNDSGVTWTPAYLLRLVGDAQRAIVLVRPNAYQVRKALTLVEGQAVQNLPAGTVRLIKIMRNLGADGNTVGRRVTVANEDQLDRVDPNWHASSPKAYVSHYTYDKDAPLIYSVFPRPNAALRLDAVVSENPAAPSASSDTLVLGDEYLNPIVDYMLHRAWDKNSERRDVSKSQAALSSFMQSLGLKKTSDVEQDPDVKAQAE